MDTELKHLLIPYKDKIEAYLKRKMENFRGTKLQEACSYALSNGGKRFRPTLVLMVAEALQKGLEPLEAATAIEYFHTASLLADDLPCMDDDRERRGAPSTHILYGEAIALLASYALIAEGYQLIVDQGKTTPAVSDHVTLLAIENATKNTGIFGATGGQFLDLFPVEASIKAYDETALKKTVSLFEISFVFGWLFGGGSVALLDEVKKAAYHFGMAFQIKDDFDDLEKDKSLNRTMNLVFLMGEKKAEEVLSAHLEAYQSLLEKLNIASAPLLALAKF